MALYMTKSHTATDVLGDALHVGNAEGHVGLGGESVHGDYVFTPKEARRLARAIKKAAKRAEKRLP